MDNLKTRDILKALERLQERIYMAMVEYSEGNLTEDQLIRSSKKEMRDTIYLMEEKELQSKAN